LAPVLLAAVESIALLCSTIREPNRYEEHSAVCPGLKEGRTASQPRPDHETESSGDRHIPYYPWRTAISLIILGEVNHLGLDTLVLRRPNLQGLIPWP